MAMREYRKGNWTVEETMILIEAKKKDDERRKFSRSKLQTSPSSGSSSSKPVTELRWKWVEEFCWAKTCFRSQNQCNDKWDNLMRDYKKVRDYQKCYNNKNNINNIKSYWDMDKVERKDKGLPTNMLPQIYEALFDVVERVTSSSNVVTSGLISATVVQLQVSPPPPPPPPPRLPPSLQALQLSPPPRLTSSLPAHGVFHPSPPVPVLLPHPSPTLLETETSEQPQQQPSPAKKKKRADGGGGGGGGAGGGSDGGREGPSGVATQTPTTTEVTSLQEVNSTIHRSTTMILEAIQASQESEERRHRETINLHESRLRVEESRLEINRQGFNALSDAINRLASSIFTWANNSQKNQQGPS